jgi:signal transduction histidine kinase
MEPGSDLPLNIRANHETVFCIFLVLLAFLFRNHPAIVYPQLLYVLSAFLAFNFLFNRFLRQPDASPLIAYLAVFVNGILITSATSYSGGPSSYLWVMYLLPIFSSCLLFNARMTGITTAYVILLHAGAYWNEFYRFGSLSWLEGLSRVGLLALSASITESLAASERASKKTAQKQREKLEEALRTLSQESDRKPQDGGISKAGFRKAAHEINNIMTVILGSAEILLLDHPQAGTSREDLNRIKSAARRCVNVIKDLSSSSLSDKSHV